MGSWENHRLKCYRNGKFDMFFFSSQEGIQTSPSSNPLFKQNWINQTPVSFVWWNKYVNMTYKMGP